MMKTCKKCGEEKPATSEYFPKRKGSKDGFKNDCKECVSLYTKKYYEKNKEKYKQYNEIYYQENREERQRYAKDYYKENSDKVIKYQRAYYEENRDRVLQRQRVYESKHKDKKREYDQEYAIKNADKKKAYLEENKEYITMYKKEYRERNKEQLIEYRKKYYQENKEYISSRRKAWRLNNMEVERSYSHKRKAKLRALPHTLTVEEWDETLSYFENKCCYCGENTDKLQQDHFIPLSKNGSYTKSNIVPACQFCNMSKNNKPFEEWYPRQEWYSEVREQKILSFIGKYKEK